MHGQPPNPNGSPSTPRWVKAFGIISVVLVLLFIVMVIAGGNHGLGRHLPTGSAPDDHTPPISVAEYHAQQP